MIKRIAAIKNTGDTYLITVLPKLILPIIKSLSCGICFVFVFGPQQRKCEIGLCEMLLGSKGSVKRQHNTQTKKQNNMVSNPEEVATALASAPVEERSADQIMTLDEPILTTIVFFS